MVAWVLNLCYLGLLLLVSPVLVYRAWRQGKYRTGWREKLWGEVPERDAAIPCVWLHAVSVGEVLQLKPVLHELQSRRPELEIVISTTTVTGHEQACKQYPHCRVIYFPLDFSWAVHAALERIRPVMIGLVELELWPNFVRAASRRQIPLVLINGRMSERSFRGYRRVRWLMRSLLSRFSLCLVQTETYRQRLAELGTPADILHITGNIKFDRLEADRHNPRTSELARAFALRPHEQVFIAGSTQDPEERFALDAYLSLREKHRDLRLILVPRHKERFEEVAQLVTDIYHLPLRRRSATQAMQATPSPQASGSESGCRSVAVPADNRDGQGGEILLLDTLGELTACWGLADIAFVGGSLTRRGGQNMMEPAAYGAAIMFGPNTQNFRDVVEMLLDQQAARVVHSPQELTQQLDEWLSHPERAQDIGLRAQRLVLPQRGATGRTIVHCEQILSRVLGPAEGAETAATVVEKAA